MKIIGIIPARFESSRFPGKPLINLLGKPMIEHVYNRCKKADRLADVVVATDDERILKAVQKFGGKVVMTSTVHESGTERCAEALSKINSSADCIINIQGDEPLIDPKQINQLADMLQNRSATIATLARKIIDERDWNAHQVVKVVVNKNNEALYFSRSLIPFARTNRTVTPLQHVGIYGYHVSTLREIVDLPQSVLEQCEGLEQLRWLDHGYKIHVGLTHGETHAIDTPDDVDNVIKLMEKNGNT